MPRRSPPAPAFPWNAAPLPFAPSMSPGAATLLSLLLPGAAHFKLGRPGLGVLALLTCFGPMLAGVAILGERLFFYELFSGDLLAGIGFDRLLKVLPINVWPEAFHISGVFVAGFEHPGDAPAAQRAIRTVLLEHGLEHLATWLTAAAGMVSILWAADARWRAQERRAPGIAPAAAAALSWFLPGLGHVRAGQKDKGLLMGGAVIVLFAGALLLSAGTAVDRVMAPVWWIGQNLFGGGTLFTSLVTGPMRIEGPFPQYHDLGKVVCTTAGLLNIVVMIDAWAVAAGDVERRDLQKEAA